MTNDDYIRTNIEEIRKKVGKAALKSGRNAEEIKIIAVTKTVEPERIIRAVAAGLTDLGENRVQELCEKYDIVGSGCSWHLIGHLQTNKVKYIIDKVSLIHSVDSLELADEIQKRAKKAGKVMDILVQVNISGEESKFGINASDTIEFLRKISKFANLHVKGLMTIAPLTANPEDARPVFRDLKKLLIDIRQENIDNIYMDILSMGMSGDYEIAIEEGSNMVRIGTAIFGSR